MKPHFNKLLRAALISAGSCMALISYPAASGPTDLADGPLANATTAAILPNIMFDLDNSGSMAWDYMPDYVRYTSPGEFVKWCRGVDGSNTLVLCEPGDPPFFASGFNSLYYNPTVTYSWPVNADGSRKPDWANRTAYTDFTTVASDGYGIQNIDDSSRRTPYQNNCRTGSCPVIDKVATTNLVTGYPERVWCLSNNDTPPSANCKSALENNAYTYPNDNYDDMKVVYGAPYYYNVSVEWCSRQTDNYGRAGFCQARKDWTFKYVRFFNWSRVDIKPTTTFPLKAPTRSDCAGTRCTYAEEMSNFANWYAWYRTRMQMTKSAIGLAFRDVRGTPKSGAALTADPADPTFLHARVGLTTINNPVVVNIANFDSAQRTLFYSNLYAAYPDGGTPLRTSLESVGKMYQGITTTYADPIQYSCQRNFTILATDGYWNDNYTGAVGNPDGVTGVSRPSFDGSQTADTLADVAYKYYHTDLRPGNCTSPDICTNNVPPSGNNAAVDDVAQHQHMTTFTVSLGVDGTLTYDDNYKTSTTGDYFAIKQGAKNWPAPWAGGQETIDDLWHAAVNGRGTYFSTKDPRALEEGLQRALNSIERTTGSGAAAATSNLQPTAGDNFIYIATYRTQKWDGELNAYSIDLGTGVVSTLPIWQTEPLLKAQIGAAGDTDTRVIYTANQGAAGLTRTLFKAGTGGMTAAQLALFDNTKLSQYIDWTAAQKTATTPTHLVNALRGQDRNEDQDRALAYGTYSRLYRDREKVLGDIIHAQPIFVKAPPHNFSDTTYAAFKAANAGRVSNLYVASNDGMLHAFDGATGQERWAYVPPMVLPEMWRLADTNYENNHRFFLDGPMTITDAKIGTTWKTILIGAMGKGGRGYYALDVTDPVDPQPLWNFTADNNPNLGYSYGTPFIMKLKTGAWVAVVASGYNNIPEGAKYAGADGKGYVFILNLADGSVLRTITTDVGTTADPSGLARLNIWSYDFDSDPTAEGAYGGDLYGNMWRFDLEAGTASKVVSFGANKPIMVAPEVSLVKTAPSQTKPALFFGSGRYLGEDDLTNTQVQSIYGIKDDGTTTLNNTARLVQQTTTDAGTSRNISTNAVDWTTGFGWFVNLPDSGERVTIDPQLFFGTVVFATTVPTASACQPGGYSWLYQLDILTGGNVVNSSAGASKYTSPIVGMTVSKLPGGTPVIYSITADGKKPVPKELELDPGTSGSTEGTRVLWREIFD